MFRAGTIGSPLLRSSPRVRANFAVEYLSSRSPTTGQPSRAACQRRRFSGRASALGTAYAAAPPSRSHAHQPLVTSALAPTSSRVESGSPPPTSDRIAAKRGITKPSSTSRPTQATTPMSAGYSSADAT